jgi:pantothenate kinase type III
LGQNTGAAISNGILAAICGMLESMGVTENSDCEPMDVVLTGGDASLILPLLVLKAQIKTHLVLDGLRIMFDQQ